MKKIIAFAILLISVLAMTSTSHAAEWKKSINSSGETIYSTSLESGISCSVVEKADGDLAVYATDPSWHGKSVIHSGRVHFSGPWTENLTVMHEPSKDGYINMNEGGYHVFTARCTEAANELPIEVRRKFRGTYGVKAD